MATVTSVSLSPLAPMPTNPNAAEATVAYSISFAADDVGKEHRIAVELCAEDLPGDDEAPPPGQLGVKVVYTFIFGLKTYKAITAMAGPYSETVKAIVPLSKLDEDPLKDSIRIPPDYKPVPIRAHEDDVYARVSVSRVVDGRSTTQHITI